MAYKELHGLSIDENQILREGRDTFPSYKRLSRDRNSLIIISDRSGHHVWSLASESVSGEVFGDAVSDFSRCLVVA